MTSSIRVDGRTTVVPGSYTTIDRSGLQNPGLGSSGVVAVIGTAIGGRPVTDIDSPADIPTFNRESQVRNYFRSGDLRDVASPLFFPSQDPDVTGGAERILFLKTNNATGSKTVLSNSEGAIIEVTSNDFGEFTNGYAVQVLDDASSADDGDSIVRVIENGTATSVDGVGGFSACRLTYTQSTFGYTGMAASILAGAITANGSKNMAGRNGEIAGGTNAADGPVSIVSSATDDKNAVVIIGTQKGTGDAISETLLLDGTNTVTSSKEFAVVYGVEVQQQTVYPGAPGMTSGTVQVLAGSTELYSVDPTGLGAGIEFCQGVFVANGKLELTASADCTVMVAGTAPSGAPVVQKYSLSAGVALETAESFKRVGLVCTSDLADAQSLRFEATAASTNALNQSNLGQCLAYFNSLREGSTGFQMELRDPTFATFQSTNLDNLVGTQDAHAGGSGGTGYAEFTADVFAVVEAINGLPGISAARIEGALGGRPAYMAAPQYLSGGSEGGETNAHIQKAFDLLRRIDVNSVLVMSYEANAHKMLINHCTEMCGAGRSERDGFVGLLKKGGNPASSPVELPPKSHIIEQIQNMNTRHVRAFGQSVFMADSGGIQREFGPAYMAAAACGSQAGSSIGTALTAKTIAVNAIKSYAGPDGGWNPFDDAEQMILAGLCFYENLPQGGISCVRNCTTKLGSDDPSMTNAEVNEAVNYAVLNFRRRLQNMVGRSTFVGTANQAKQLAGGVLNQLVAEGVVQSWGALDAYVEADKIFLEVTLQPSMSVNFVKSTIYLTANEIA